MTRSLKTRGTCRLPQTCLALAVLGLSGVTVAQTIEPTAVDAAPNAAPPAIQREAPATSPWYVGINQSFSRESNVLRASNTGVLPIVSDSYSLTTLLAGFDQPFGRQRVYANAAVRGQRYSTNDQLNNTGYGIEAGLDWATVERLSGRLVLNAGKVAVNPADSPNPDKASNTEDSTQLEALFRLGLITRLAFEADFITRKVDYSTTLLAPREFKQNSAAFGLRYRFSDLLTVGAGLRKTKATYPRFAVDPVSGADIADELDRNDLDLRAEWTPSAISSVSARLSYGKSDYLRDASRDYRGATGNLSWNWRPLGKLGFTTTASRESGQESARLQSTTASSTSGPTGLQTSDLSRLTNSLSIGATYQLTAKIDVTASARADRRTLVQSTPAASGTDTTEYLSLGTVWNATRNVSLGCNVGREKRTADTTLSAPYSSNVAGCFGQVMLR